MLHRLVHKSHFHPRCPWALTPTVFPIRFSVEEQLALPGPPGLRLVVLGDTPDRKARERISVGSNNLGPLHLLRETPQYFAEKVLLYTHHLQLFQVLK